MRHTRLALFLFAGVVLLLLGGQAQAGAPSVDVSAWETGRVVQSAAPLTNEWCPVLTDEAVDPELYTEYEGRRVYLCCRKCLKQFTADPELYAGNLPAFVSEAPDPQTAGGGHEQEQEHGHAETDEEAGGHSHQDSSAAGSEQEHDHSDHGDGAQSFSLMQWLGRFHPMVVHFPIALLLMAAAAELLLIVTSASRFAFAARFCLWGGAASAMLAAALGWVDAQGVVDSYTGFAERVLYFHRWVGVSTALVAGLTLLTGELSLRSSDGQWKRAYRGLLFFCALLVSVAGHLGASLIYGWEYLSW